MCFATRSRVRLPKASGQILSLARSIQHSHNTTSPQMTSTLPPLAQAISGAIGAAAANVGSYPFDLATTRIQTSNSKRRPKGFLEKTLHRRLTC